MAFVLRADRLVAGLDGPYVDTLARLLRDGAGWQAFMAALDEAVAAHAPASARSVKNDARTLKIAVDNSWQDAMVRQYNSRAREALETDGGRSRALPHGLERTDDLIRVLVPPSIDVVSNLVFRFLKVSHDAGTVLLSNGETLFANLLSSTHPGEAPSWRLQPTARDTVLLIMLAQAEFSRELGENVNLIMPPPEIVSAVHRRLIEQAPRLLLRTAVPWLNGTEIVTRQGYHRGTGVWFEPPAPNETYAYSPTASDVRQALRTLSRIYFGGFKFQKHADKVNLLGMALMAIVMPGSAGRSPMALVRKPQPDSGGSWLCRLIVMTAMGTRTEAQLWPTGDPDEQRKKLLAALRTRPAAMLFDNVAGALEGEALAVMSESSMITDRVLGTSDTVTIDIKTLIMLSANNATVSGEILRRLVVIRLAAFVDARERLSYRAGRIGTEEGWLATERKPAIEALLTLVAWWIAQGRPLGRSLNSFSETTAAVGGILAAAGIRGWLDNRSDDDMAAVLDDADNEAPAVIETLWEIKGGTSWRPSDVLADWPHDDLPLPIRTSDNPDAATRAARLGKWLRKNAGVPVTLTARDVNGEVITVQLSKGPHTRVGSTWSLQIVRSQFTLV